MLELLLDFLAFSVVFDFISWIPKLLDDDVVDLDTLDDADTDVFDFLKVTPDLLLEGQRGLSRHSSGLNDEKSARIPLSVDAIF